MKRSKSSSFQVFSSFHTISLLKFYFQDYPKLWKISNEQKNWKNDTVNSPVGTHHLDSTIKILLIYFIMFIHLSIPLIIYLIHVDALQSKL